MPTPIKCPACHMPHDAEVHNCWHCETPLPAELCGCALCRPPVRVPDPPQVFIHDPEDDGEFIPWYVIAEDR